MRALNLRKTLTVRSRGSSSPKADKRQRCVSSDPESTLFLRQEESSEIDSDAESYGFKSVPGLGLLLRSLILCDRHDRRDRVGYPGFVGKRIEHRRLLAKRLFIDAGQKHSL